MYLLMWRHRRKLKEEPRRGLTWTEQMDTHTDKIHERAIHSPQSHCINKEIFTHAHACVHNKNTHYHKHMWMSVCVWLDLEGCGGLGVWVCGDVLFCVLLCCWWAPTNVKNCNNKERERERALRDEDRKRDTTIRRRPEEGDMEERTQRTRDKRRRQNIRTKRRRKEDDGRKKRRRKKRAVFTRKTNYIQEFVSIQLRKSRNILYPGIRLGLKL